MPFSFRPVSFRLASALTAAFALVLVAEIEPARSEPLMAVHLSTNDPAALVPASVSRSIPAAPGFSNPVLAPATAAAEVNAPAATPVAVEPATDAKTDAKAEIGDRPVLAAPVLPKGLALSSLVSRLRDSVPGSRELECLAGAIYFESKSEPLAGQLAVGEVIVNRTKSGKFPRSYCGVVYQPGQFSFVRGGSMPRINRGHVQWKNAVAIARIVDEKLHDTVMPRALFFHATHVSPGWRRARVATLGRHVFYR